MAFDIRHFAKNKMACFNNVNNIDFNLNAYGNFKSYLNKHSKFFLMPTI